MLYIPDTTPGSFSPFISLLICRPIGRRSNRFEIGAMFTIARRVMQLIAVVNE